jgi:anti-sigma factor RsiW
VIDRSPRWSLTRRHPRGMLLSRYLEGELGIDDRRALETHLRGCARCRRVLDSLAETIRSLGSLKQEPATRVADSVIAALRADSPLQGDAHERSVGESGPPALALVLESAPPPPPGRPLRHRSRAQAVVRCCLRRRQLRLTVSIALLTGVALSIINQGGMLFDGRIDFGMCAMCAANFVVPFVALNAALLIVLRIPARGNR